MWLRTPAERFDRQMRLAGAAVGVVAALGVLFRAIGAPTGVVVACAITAATGAAFALLAWFRHDRAQAQERAAREWSEPIRIGDAQSRGHFYELGVETEAPQAIDALSGGNSVPTAYRWRRVDEELDRRLGAASGTHGTHLIVLAGPSKAGKSRTLLEAAARQVSGAWLVAPRGADALERLAGSGPPLRRAHGDWVIWLDDIETFARRGAGLDLTTLRAFAQWRAPVLVLATQGGKGSGAMSASDSELVSDLLTRYPPIELSRGLDGLELGRLNGTVPDAGFERIEAEGLGVFMIAAARLLQRFNDESCLEGRAIVAAAIDYRRAGLVTSATEDDLRELYRHYLKRPASEDGFRSGLRWATEPLYASVALLRASGVDDGYLAYDYLVDVVTERGDAIPSATWRFLRTRTATDEDALLALASRAARVSAPAQAEEILRELDASGSAMGARRLGELLADRDDAVGAEAAFVRADERGDGVAAVHVGVLRHKRGDLQGAEEAWIRAVERGEPSGACNLARFRWTAGRLDDADRLYVRALDGRHAHAGLGLASLRIERGDPEGAAEAYRRGDALGDPENSFRLGNLQRDQGDLTAARHAYRRAEAWGHDEAAFQLAVILIEEDDWSQAEPISRRADERGSAKAANLVGYILSNRGDREGALAAFERAQERGNAHASNNLGLDAAEQGDVVAAEALYRRADDEGCSHAPANLGQLLEQRGERDEARQVYRRGDERGDGLAAWRLGCLLQDEEHVAEAETAFERAVSRGQAGAGEWLGILLERRGAIADALAAFRRADELGSGAGARELGRLLDRTGELDEAEAALRRAISRGDRSADGLLGALLMRRAEQKRLGARK